MSSRLVRTGTLTAAGLCSVALLLPAVSSAAPAAVAARIHDIQGSTRVSPLEDRPVTEVPGVVTAVRNSGTARGFWLQDPQPDADPATSEGIFVFTGKQAPDVEPGDALRVSGTVSEYYPGGKATGIQSVTQLTDASWQVTARNRPLPPPVRLTPRSVPDRYAPSAGGGSVERRQLQPDHYALDRYESLEGMRTAVGDKLPSGAHGARVTGATNEHDELWVTTDPSQHPTPRGGTLYGGYDQQNGARVKVSSLLPAKQHPFPRANVGDELRGTTEGPLDYDEFGGYTVRATQLGELKDHKLTRERTRRQQSGELSVATYNVENLSPQSAEAKYTRLSEALVHNLSSPDIVAVEEVQDDSGPTDDGTVSAGRTLRKLTAAIHRAGGPAYQWRQISPVDNADGGQPGGNIRVAFLYNPQRVSFADRAGGDATTPVQVGSRHGKPALSVNPGRIAPRDPAWKASRKPLAGEFTFRGRQVFVLANHFSSKGGGDLAGDQPMEGRYQPPTRRSEPQRTEQAKLVNSAVRSIRSHDPKAAVVAAGDFNDFPFSPTLKTLRSHGALTSPLNQLPADERYGYVFNGNSQTLDHILTSPGTGHAEYDIVHLNAEFHDQVSDHDPSVIRTRLR